MMIAIIAAIGRNRVIGKDGRLPWHLSDDLKRFKRLTTGHGVLMGRRTYQSLGRPLPHRRNVVLSSQSIPGVECYGTIEEALAALRDMEKVFVIGGAHVYRQLLNRADLLYLTFVDRPVEGDAFFPPYEELLASKFREVARETHEGFEFVDYVRIVS